MPLSVRNMVAILVTIVILAGVAFTATLYYPTNKRAQRTAKIRAVLEAQVEGISPAVTPAKRRIELMDTMRMDIDFFKKRNVSPNKGIPELLEQMNRMCDRINIQLVAVKPLDGEDAPGHRLYPFVIEARGPYSDLVNFVHRMENVLRLSLHNIRIKVDKKDHVMHRLQFTLNIFELKDELPVGQGDSAEDPTYPPADMHLVSVQEDPFSPKKQEQVAQLPEKPKETEPVHENFTRPKLVLTGIVDVEGSRFVIINDEILSLGETIDRETIGQIEEDHVIIIGGDKTYPLYLKGSSPLEKGALQ
jgi:Tfp pilus assembly protein PilO